jgi:hypothetical protein
MIDMRKEPKMERLRVGSLKELDALVGKYLTKETPQIFWEEQQVCLRFDSIEEALEAMHDPYFQQFIPKDALPHSSLTEVQEFRAYSSDLNCAWEVVEHVASDTVAFQVHREKGQWIASFGDHPTATSRSAPIAICIAALRACGIDVELPIDWAPAPAQENPVRSRAVA